MLSNMGVLNISLNFCFLINETITNEIHSNLNLKSDITKNKTLIL